MKRRVIIVATLGPDWADVDAPELDDVATWIETLADETGEPAFLEPHVYRSLADLKEDLESGADSVDPGDIPPKDGCEHRYVAVGACWVCDVCGEVR